MSQWDHHVIAVDEIGSEIEIRTVIATREAHDLPPIDICRKTDLENACAKNVEILRFEPHRADDSTAERQRGHIRHECHRDERSVWDRVGRKRETESGPVAPKEGEVAAVIDGHQRPPSRVRVGSRLDIDGDCHLRYPRMRAVEKAV